MASVGSAARGGPRDTLRWRAAFCGAALAALLFMLVRPSTVSRHAQGPLARPAAEPMPRVQTPLPVPRPPPQPPPRAAWPPPPAPGSEWWRSAGVPHFGGGRWEVDPGPKQGELTPRLAGVPPLPVEQLRRCLAGRHWAFIGDSVLRYVWMTMVALVDPLVPAPQPVVPPAANQFWASFASPEPAAEVAAAARKRGTANASVVWQKEWPTWGAYLAGSTARFGGRMCCDCFRCNQPDHTSGRGRRSRVSARTMRAKRDGYWKTQRENRYYHGGGCNASFIFLHGDSGGYGDRPGWRPGCPGHFGDANSTQAPSTQQEAAQCTQCPCPPQWPPRPPWKERWRGRIPDAAEALQRWGGKADVLVVNGGLWHPRWAANRGDGEEAVRAAEGALRPGGRAVWVTTTQQCQRGAPKAEEEGGVTAAVGSRITQGGPWALLNASRVTGELKAALGVPSYLGAHSAPTIVQLPFDIRMRCAMAFVDANGHMQPRLYAELLRLLAFAAGCAP
eukprot:TRINITY_DN60294_c0_g1_i1.p1 TRINITY_DN60294_c0_g1~~TRINITY_DN60294_c0_g1_i1.p1  ORF type:complete len:504 (+),score=106.60 TRINITY_DN60294_c0_g1_i1:79-1590(+)